LFNDFYLLNTYLSYVHENFHVIISPIYFHKNVSFEIVAVVHKSLPYLPELNTSKCFNH